MKRMLMLVLMILLASSISFAEEKLSLSDSIKDIASKIPDLKQGIAFSLIDNKVNYITTIKVVEFGKWVNLEAGYAGDAEPTNHKLAGALSFNLVESGFIKLPILKYIEFKPGLYVALGNINVKELGESEFDAGISATLLTVKF